MNAANRNQNIYARITEAVIQSIENGAGAWSMPWHASASRPVNIASNKPYRGINILSLWIAANEKNYRSAVWGTYRQWAARDAQIRKGEKATPIVFYREFEAQELDPGTGETKTETRLAARMSLVFNADQVEGYEPESPAASENPVDAIKTADAFIAGTDAHIRHGGDRAFYAPFEDRIQTPPREAFIATETSTATEGYYATILHELIHWSGAAHRLDRQFGARFGDDAYAMEKLCAELGAAFLCADLGVSNRPRPDHAAYLDHWLKVLKADKRAIFTAASQAMKAVEFLSAGR